MQKNPDWRVRMQEIFQVCQEEVKRTTEIGKKMLTASKTNTGLHEAYEELGIFTAEALKNGDLQWDEPKVARLLETISNCEKDLRSIQDEVNDIRFAQSSEKHKASDQE